MKIQHTDTHTYTDAAQSRRKSSASVVVRLLILVFVLISINMENVVAFTKEEDGVLYTYQDQSYAVQQMPFFGAWNEFFKDKPKTIEVHDGHSIAVCQCCGIKIDVTNDIDWRMVKDHTITVGTKIKFRQEEKVSDLEVNRYYVGRLLRRDGIGCHACWLEYMRILDYTNTQNKHRKELNDSREALAVLLKDLYEAKKELVEPAVPVEYQTCPTHPSMKGFCACLMGKRTRPREVKVRIEDERTNLMPYLVAYIDIAEELRRIELPMRESEQVRHDNWMAYANRNNPEEGEVDEL